MAESIFNKIKANMDYYSGIEKKIADLILLDPDRFITLSMNALAKEAEVSQGSINNFAKKVCGGGFSALKLQMAQQIPGYKPKSFSVVNENDGIKDILNKTIEHIEAAFRNTAELNSEEALQKAADMILRAKKIELFGVYRSGSTAKDFYYQLLQLGLPAAFESDALMCPISAAMLDKDGLVIAVSSSGRTVDIIDAVKRAKENGASVLCITSNAHSPLAKLSDNVLITVSSGATIIGSANETYLSQGIIAECLCSYLRYKLDRNGENQYFRLRGIMNSHNIDD